MAKDLVNDVKIKLCDGEIVANKDKLMAILPDEMMLSNSMIIEGETSSVDKSHSSNDNMEKIINYLICGQIKFTDISFTQVMELHVQNDASR